MPKTVYEDQIYMTYFIAEVVLPLMLLLVINPSDTFPPIRSFLCQSVLMVFLFLFLKDEKYGI